VDARAVGQVVGMRLDGVDARRGHDFP
jgi:hypothetical protein